MRHNSLLPKVTVLSVLIAGLLLLGSPSAHAAPKPTSINLVPTITSITVQNGQLLASGVATAVIHGTTFTAPFSNVPVNIALDPSGGVTADGCPILDLSLGPINLNLLGLVVQTSPICLKITAFQNGGLLGSLLCSIANALNTGLSLQQVLGLLTLDQLSSLLTGLTSLFNQALAELSNAVLTAINNVNSGHTCTILTLSLGPLDLTLLGLNVHLDNCSNGPVTVTITAVTGKGNLLGNLLCQLADANLLNLGATLQGILNQIVGLL